MQGSIVVGVVVLTLTVLGGVWATLRSPSWQAGPRLRTTSARVAEVVDTGLTQLGRIGGGVLVLLAGGGLTVLLTWCFGGLVKALEPVIDHPLFAWFQQRQNAEWSKIWRVLTNIGSLDVSQGLTALAMVLIPLLWMRRRWWIPLMVLPTVYFMEKFLQDGLKVMVDRGHPPTTLGSFPSGGCARVLVVYGLIVFFVLRWSGTRDRRWIVGGAAFVVLCEMVQAYARTYNLEHWITDVFGGMLFGALLLGVGIAASLVMDREPTHTSERPPRLGAERAVHEREVSPAAQAQPTF